MKINFKFWFLKDKKVTQPGKNLILAKKSKISLKVGCFEVSQKLIRLMCYFWVYMIHHSCLYISAKVAYFGKIIFSSYKRKSSQPIRLQDF